MSAIVYFAKMPFYMYEAVKSMIFDSNKNTATNIGDDENTNVEKIDVGTQTVVSNEVSEKNRANSWSDTSEI